MDTLKNDDVIKDNEESRTGLERRQFYYTAYIPERRSGEDRRRSLKLKKASNRMRSKACKRNQTNGDL